MGRAFPSLGSAAYIVKGLAQSLKHHLMSIYSVPNIMPHAGHTEVSYDEVIGGTDDFQIIIVYYGKECCDGESHAERTERTMKRTGRTSQAAGLSGQRIGGTKRLEAVHEMWKDATWERFGGCMGRRGVRRKKGLGCLIKCNNEPNFGRVSEVTTAQHLNNNNNIM